MRRARPPPTLPPRTGPPPPSRTPPPPTVPATRESAPPASWCRASVGPRWQQGTHYIRKLPEYWQQLSSKPGVRALLSAANEGETIKKGLADLAIGLPNAASTLFGIAGAAFGSILSLVTLTFLALFL